MGVEESGYVKRWPWQRGETRVNVKTVHPKNGRCREVAVSKGLTVAKINDHFFLSFHIPLLWFPAAMDTILGSQKNKQWLDTDCIVIVCDNKPA